MLVTQLGENRLQRTLEVTAQPFPESRVQHLVVVARPRPGPYLEEGKTGHRGLPCQVRARLRGVVYVDGPWPLVPEPVGISFRLREAWTVVKRDVLAGLQLFLGLGPEHFLVFSVGRVLFGEFGRPAFYHWFVDLSDGFGWFYFLHFFIIVDSFSWVCIF